MNELEIKSKEIRKSVMEVCYKTQSGHPSSALSAVEILTALYYGKVMRWDAENPKNPERDRFILSKGHACILQYVILSDLGYFDKRLLDKFCKKDSILGGHANSLLVPGIEYTAGALGHGLSYAMGQALNFKYLGMKNKVYVLLGDGECQEGSVWEAALCAANMHLDNLTVIIDENKLQSSDYVNNISSIAPLEDKWKAFGYETYKVDGHSIEALLEVFAKPSNGKPKAIIADTYKGKGVSLMENKNHWHAKRPNAEQWEMVKQELGIE